GAVGVELDDRLGALDDQITICEVVLRAVHLKGPGAGVAFWVQRIRFEAEVKSRLSALRITLHQAVQVRISRVQREGGRITGTVTRRAAEDVVVTPVPIDARLDWTRRVEGDGAVTIDHQRLDNRGAVFRILS